MHFCDRDIPDRAALIRKQSDGFPLYFHNISIYPVRIKYNDVTGK